MFDDQYVSPVAKRVLDKLGGVPKVAKILNRKPSGIYKWTYPRARSGTGGLIPSECQQPLLDYAHANGIADLTPEDFFEDPAERVSCAAHDDEGGNLPVTGAAD